MADNRKQMNNELVKNIEEAFSNIKDKINTETTKRQDEATARQDIFDQDLPRIKTGINAERE